MPRMIYLVKGPVQPYTTTTYKGKFVSGTAYQKYADYKRRVKTAVIETMGLEGWKVSKGEPLRIAVIYNRGVLSTGLHQRDLTNILKGTEDGAQRAAYQNDAWTDQEVALRANSENAEDTLLLVVQPIKEGPNPFSTWMSEIEVLATDMGFVL